MKRFTSQLTRFSRRPSRFGPFVPLPPGELPDQVLLTEVGAGLQSESGGYFLLELAVASATESAITTETAKLILSQDSLYLRYE